MTVGGPRWPHARRGFTMLLALGLVTLVTLAVMVSLTLVERESEAQGEARRQREAFYAAEAGMAEGRERLRLLVGADGTYSGAIAALGPLVSVAEPALPGTYYEVLGWQRYGLDGAAMDPLVSGPNLERTGPGGQALVGYPTQAGVRYRVFLRDDADDGSPAIDANGRVWLVAVGEVADADRQPTRAVVQALVTPASQAPVATPGCIGRGCGAAMDFVNGAESALPDMSVRRDL